MIIFLSSCAYQSDQSSEEAMEIMNVRFRDLLDMGGTYSSWIVNSFAPNAAEIDVFLSRRARGVPMQWSSKVPHSNKKDAIFGWQFQCPHWPPALEQWKIIFYGISCYFIFGPVEFQPNELLSGSKGAIDVVRRNVICVYASHKSERT